MKCQWQSDCSNEGTNEVYRALSEEESQSLEHGEGIIWSIPLYHQKTVCNDCVHTARQTYSASQAEIDADSRL
jgi:hypothetical protein